MSMLKMNTEIWRKVREHPGSTTPDAGGWTSVPTLTPARWDRTDTLRGLLTYVSDTGEYEIVREPHLSTFFYYVKRRAGYEWVRISIASFGRLSDAKMYACRNARGEDRYNIA